MWVRQMWGRERDRMPFLSPYTRMNPLNRGKIILPHKNHPAVICITITLLFFSFCKFSTRERFNGGEKSSEMH